MSVGLDIALAFGAALAAVALVVGAIVIAKLLSIPAPRYTPAHEDESGLQPA